MSKLSFKTFCIEYYAAHRSINGTTLEIKKPKILRSEIGRDFGFAFCTEESLKQLQFVKSYRVEE